MRIPNAKVSLVKETKSRYQLKLDGHFKYNFDKLGHSAKAEIEFNSGGSVTINVPGDPNFPKTFTEADDGKEIKLNNDCNLVQTVSDLELLYNFIIEDKINKTKKFEIDRHPADKPRSEKTSNEESNSNLRMESHDPAPLQEGLPCYVTRADDSTGLPEGD